MATEAAGAATARWIEEHWREHPPTAGFRLEAASAAAGVLEIAFRWRGDPQGYLVRFAHPDFVEEILGDDFTAEQAGTELRMWLMEELDTGFVGRAARRPVGDRMLLGKERTPHSGWFVGDVPLVESPASRRRAEEEGARTGSSAVVVPSWDDDREPIADPGRFLDQQGLDGSWGRRAVRDGVLIAWLQVDRGDLGDRRAGQVVVVRDGPAAAAIPHLEVRDPEAFPDLAGAACRRAVEAGARTITAPLELRRLEALGFRERAGRLEVRHDELRAPPA